MKFVVAAMVFALSTAQASAQEVLDDSIPNVGEEKAHDAISAVTSKLKDPTSAQFMSFTHPDQLYSQYPKNTVCGMVNAKNGFGGYVGFSPFAYSVLTKTTIILSPEVLSGAGGKLATTGFKFTNCASALGVQL